MIRSESTVGYLKVKIAEVIKNTRRLIEQIEMHAPEIVP